MRTYMAEVYIPASSGADVEAAVRRLTDMVASRSGPPRVRYLRSTFVPEDEVCYHVFEAESEALVREVGVRAAVTFDRLVETRESP